MSSSRSTAGLITSPEPKCNTQFALLDWSYTKGAPHEVADRRVLTSMSVDEEASLQPGSKYCTGLETAVFPLRRRCWHLSSYLSVFCS